ncbi:hypothetical protein KIPB_001789, partial [Kipferlia bialata]
SHPPATFVFVTDDGIVYTLPAETLYTEFETQMSKPKSEVRRPIPCTLMFGTETETRGVAISETAPVKLMLHSPGCAYVYNLTAYSALGQLPVLIKPQGTDLKKPLACACGAFDTHSSDYACVAYGSGSMALYSTQSGAPLSSFDKGRSNITGLGWLHGRVGQFIVSEKGSGTLRVYNASKGHSTDRIRCGAVGVAEICVIPSASVRGERAAPASLLAARSEDGTFSLVSLSSGSTLLVTEGNHVETIFDIELRPGDPDALASCGFDGSVILWDIQGCRKVDTIVQTPTMGTGISVSAIKWDPRPSSRWLLVADAGGCVRIVDTVSRKTLCTVCQHSSGVKAIAWSSRNPSLIASCTRAGVVAVHKISTSKSKGELSSNQVIAFKHNYCTNGVAFSNHHDTLAVTLASGEVALHDFTRGSKPLMALTGHSAACFSVTWHPIYPEVLATTSDDHTVRVYYVSLASKRYQLISELKGHRDKVRPILFHPVCPRICVSGGWDCSVRVHDWYSGKQIGADFHHSRDTYGLAIHPRRPFTLVTAGRDLSIRILNLRALAAPVVQAALFSPSQPDPLMPLKAISLDGCLSDTPRIDMLEREKARAAATERERANPELRMEQGDTVYARDACMGVVRSLAGRTYTEQLEAVLSWGMDPNTGVADLLYSLTDQPQKAQRVLTSGEYFLRTTHIVEAVLSEINWYLARTDNIGARHVPVTDVEWALFGIPISSVSGKGPSGLRARIRAALRLAALSGDLRLYCSLLLRIGMDTEACSVARGVDHDFWIECTTRVLAKSANFESQEVLGLMRRLGLDTLTVPEETRQLVTSVSLGQFQEVADSMSLNNHPSSMALVAAGAYQRGDREMGDRMARMAAACWQRMGRPLLSAAQYVILQDGSMRHRAIVFKHELGQVAAEQQLQAGVPYTYAFEDSLPSTLPWSYWLNDPLLPNGRNVVTSRASNSIRYYVKMDIELADGTRERLGALFYVIPPPGGRYTPIPSDASDPDTPMPMTAHVESTPCCNNDGLVNLTGSVPCLVTSPSRGTTLSLMIENLSGRPVKQWALKYHVGRMFKSGAMESTSGTIHAIKGTYSLPHPVPSHGGRTIQPVMVDIQPNSPQHRKAGHPYKGWGKLGEYAWEKEFLTLPAEDYRQVNSAFTGEVSQILVRNTYLEVYTAALDAVPVPLASLDGVVSGTQNTEPDASEVVDPLSVSVPEARGHSHMTGYGTA